VRRAGEDRPFFGSLDVRGDCQHGMFCYADGVIVRVLSSLDG